MDPHAAFAAALHAAGPAPDRVKELGLYAFLVGDWEMDAVAHAPDGTTRTGTGEIHAGWVLEGRAIQDVWIVPPRADPGAVEAFYGTTLRVWDPALDAWHIVYIDARPGSFRKQLGRARGKDIVQEGEIEGGGRARWSFTEIAPTSFHWTGERSDDGGATWRLVSEYFARRRPAP